MEESIHQVVMQETIEERYNRKHIDAKIRQAIQANDVMWGKVDDGVALLSDWIQGEYYESKMKRLAQLKNLDLSAMVMDIFVGIAYFLKPELFTSVTAQLAARLKFSDRVDAITTVAEMVAVLCQTDAFDIEKADKQASLMLVSRIPLPASLVGFIENSQYLPPMVCEPLELTHNYSSGYLTHNDSLILGTGNHHDGDLCLDVLNLMNRVALKVDTQFLSTVEEEPTFEMKSQEQIDQWMDFKRQSYEFYSLMVKCGNRFYFNNKVDKRGRIYSVGYHLSPQGTGFKKAMLEFADEQVIEGIPDDLRLD